MSGSTVGDIMYNPFFAPKVCPKCHAILSWRNVDAVIKIGLNADIDEDGRVRDFVIGNDDLEYAEFIGISCPECGTDLELELRG